MIHVVLYEPEIPPNTGNIIRLCANTGTSLHLIHPLGFKLDDTKLLRAGLDYREWVNIKEYDSLETFINNVKPERIYAVSTRGNRIYTEVNYYDNTALIFGPETRGLPGPILAKFSEENILRIPMLTNNRSLNLSNAVAIIVYEVWRQLDFKNFTTNN